jgi:hypothetical protein
VFSLLETRVIPIRRKPVGKIPLDIESQNNFFYLGSGQGMNAGMNDSHNLGMHILEPLGIN